MEYTDVAPINPPEALPSVSRSCLPEEEDFILALLETGGNIRNAYIQVFGFSPAAGAKARAILGRAHVRARFDELQQAVSQNSLITLESHLIELAEIRDLAKAQGQLKVALSAEQSRGTAIGVYTPKKEVAPLPPDPASKLEKLASALLDRLPESRV